MGRHLAHDDVRRHHYLSSTHITLEHSKTADSRHFLSPSFPLDRARRLRRYVVDHAVDALDLVDDAGRGFAEELHIEFSGASTEPN